MKVLHTSTLKGSFKNETNDSLNERFETSINIEMNHKDSKGIFEDVPLSIRPLESASTIRNKQIMKHCTSRLDEMIDKRKEFNSTVVKKRPTSRIFNSKNSKERLKQNKIKPNLLISPNASESNRNRLNMTVLSSNKKNMLNESNEIIPTTYTKIKARLVRKKFSRRLISSPNQNIDEDSQEYISTSKRKSMVIHPFIRVKDLA